MKQKSPWAWVPTLYFAEGLPYVTVMTISLVLYKQLGLSNAEIRDGVPQTFELTGAGWGHGVGLCQIGAAVMGEKGYSYDKILLHYYHNAEIKRIYE